MLDLVNKYNIDTGNNIAYYTTSNPKLKGKSSLNRN